MFCWLNSFISFGSKIILWFWEDGEILLVIVEKIVCVVFDENVYLIMIRVVNCGNIISNI